MYKVLLFLVFSFGVLGQSTDTRSINGVIKDAQSNQPLPFASVSVSNTTRGTAANENGYFELSNVPQGTLTLVVTYVGFEAQYVPIGLGQNQPLSILLKPLDLQIQELKVTASKDKKWNAKIKRFKKEFFGVHYNEADCRLTNEYVIDFEEVDKDLIATSKVPLEIENRRLGYKITYSLVEFRSTPQYSRVFGYPKFDELSPSSQKEYRKWVQNRFEAYKQSPERFFRSLSNGSLSADGYLVYELDKAASLNVSQNHQITDQNRSKIIDQTNTLFLRQPIQIIMDNGTQAHLKSLGQVCTIQPDGWVNNPKALEMGQYWAATGLADLLPREYATLSDAAQILPARVFAHLSTDRASSGQSLGISAYLLFDKRTQPLYIQLVDQQNNLVAEETLLASNARAVGFIDLPDSLSTGFYVLKAFTHETLNIPHHIFEKKIWVKHPAFAQTTDSTSVVVSNVSEDISTEFSPEKKLTFHLIEPIKAAVVSVSVVPIRQNIEGQSILVENLAEPNKFQNQSWIFEASPTYSGMAFDLQTNKIVPNAKISLMMLSPPLNKFIDATDAGKFQILDWTFEGNKMVNYQISNSKNEALSNAILIFDQVTVPLQKHDFQARWVPAPYVEIKSTNPKKIAKDSLQNTPDKKAYSMVGTPKIYDTPDYFVEFDKPMNYPNVYEMLQGNLPGVMVMSDQSSQTYKVFVRGITTWRTEATDPLFLVDGMETKDLSIVNPNDVVRIELLSGAKAAIFGMKGATGVIAIYTKKFGQKTSHLAFAKTDFMRGYQKEKPIDLPKNNFWNPELIIAQDKPGVLDVNTLKKGTYLVEVNGVSSSGSNIHALFKIEI